MSISDILIHVENHEVLESHLRPAITLAKKTDAHLKALFISPPFFTPIYTSFDIPAEVYHSQQKLAEKEAEQMQEQVAAIAAKEGLEIRFEKASGDYLHTISRHARFADLIILGSRKNDFVAPQDIILESGRLSLVVTDAGFPASDFPENAVLAFDGSRESVTTLHQSLPLLQLCKNITVVSFDEKRATKLSNHFEQEDLSDYLSHHGIEARLLTDTVAPHAIPEALLNRVKENNADLLVMGCYGHSRFREWILGGATKEILDRLPVPVLMSH